MRKIVLSMALAALIGTPAFAQGGTSVVPKNSSDAKQALPDAPIGHRQPRRGEIPGGENNISDPNNPVNKEDAALDRKIKSICRGC